MQTPLVQSAFQKAAYLCGPEFAAEVRAHAERHQKLLWRLGNAVLVEDAVAVEEIQRLILMSYSSKVACLTRSVDKSPNVTAEWVLATAKVINPWKDCGEPIVAWAEPKGSGDGWRPVCSFGPKRKALQTLVVDILVTKFGIDSINYLAKGKGAEAGSDKVVDLIDAGYGFFVLADIKDFFRSVQHMSAQEATGLPAAVMQNSVLINPNAPLSIVGDLPYNTTFYAFDGAVRSGLPQGSRTSHTNGVKD